MSQKEIVVKPLKTIHDFTELLSLSDLKIQMGVLGFFFKDREYIIGEGKNKSYYADYDWKYASSRYTDKDFECSKTRKRYSLAERNLFLVDHKKKQLYTVNIKLVDKFKFSYDGRYLVCNYLDIRKAITFERFAQCKMHDRHHTITIWFNLEHNCVEAFSDNTVYKNGGGCGSWHDSENEKFEKNFVDDEEEGWIEDEKNKLRLAKHKAKATETFYNSKNYGEFVIKKESKKFVILWYPKDEDDNIDTTAYKLDSDELREDYFDGHDYYINSYLSFSLEDLEDLPKGGKFNSKDEAFNYIKSKFGDISCQNS